MIIFWILLISVLVFLLLRDESTVLFYKKRNNSDLLKERLVRGEISIKEYKNIKDTLGGNENEHY